MNGGRCREHDMTKDNSAQARNPTGFFQARVLSKVPEVTIYFWIIKVLCTTVGETASDFLNVDLGLGLTGTSIAMGACLLAVLFVQFRAEKYIPGVYWLAVVLISIFGTLVTDNLTDGLGVPLEPSTAVFAVALGLTFVLWYAKERTLSIHSIHTRRRECFYWLAILFTFALGTAAGDLMAESLGLGYLVTGNIVCAAIAAIIVAWRLKLDAVLSFWIAYILTRPLGASLGDYLSQTQAHGGLGLGASMTSFVFIGAILAIVLFLTFTRRDFIAAPSRDPVRGEWRPAVLWQVVGVVGILAILGGSGYYWRTVELESRTLAAGSPGAPLGDLSGFRKVAEDTLGLVRVGDSAGARARVGDLEFAWDQAEAGLRPMDRAAWSSVDDAIDDVLRKVRAIRQDASACCSSLESLIGVLDGLDARSRAEAEGGGREGGNDAGSGHAGDAVEGRADGEPGDLTVFKRIAEDVLGLVKSGEIAKARDRIKELETAWDDAETVLRPRIGEKWGSLDESIDRALGQLRSPEPDVNGCVAALQEVIAGC
jgi:uncharacterized membrane-anchored protein